VSVVISGSGAIEQLILSFKSVVSEQVEWLVRLDSIETDRSDALNRLCGVGGWSAVAANADLRDIAKDARHDTLITVSDRIQLGDGRALAALLDLLQGDETIGSASCALAAEKIIKKQAVLQPASGGLFPTRVALASGPRLAFGEPNALEALPNLTYSVAANTMHFTAWRRSALTQLPPVRVTGMGGSEEIRLGLDLIRAGYRNLCTTSVSVRLSGPYVPRDAIDPVGPGYLQMDRWEDVLRRVTIVRELF
jgi:hypothetical protein